MTPLYPPPSRQSLETDLARARQSRDFATEAACLMALGDIAKENEEYELAQGFYGQAWAACEKTGDQRKIVQAILALANLFTELSWDEENFQALFIARNLCDEALKISEQAQDYPGQGRAMKIKADLFGHVFADQEIKRSTYEHALKLCQQGADLVGQADAMMELGFMERYDDADNQEQLSFSSALNLYHEANFPQGEVRALVQLTKGAGWHKDTETKRGYYARALKLYKQLDQPLKAAEMFGELGRLASQEKDYDLALNYHKEELALCDRYSGDANGYENALYSLAHVYEAAKNYEEARLYYAKVLSLCDESDTFIFADRLYALGRVYALMGDINTGRGYAEEAISISTNNPKRDDLFNRILMRWQWGKIEYDAGYHKTGYALCREAMILAEKIPFGRHILDVWETDLAAMNCPTPPDSETSHDL